MSGNDWKRALKDSVSKAIRRGPVNHVSAINVGKGSSHTSVSSRQTVRQKDGKTTITEVRKEHRHEVGGGEDR